MKVSFNTYFTLHYLSHPEGLENLLIFNNFDRYCFLQMLFTALDVTIFCQRNELVLKSYGCSLCLCI